MLLDSLRGPLEHLYVLQTVSSEPAVVDPEGLGATITDAFVVGLRNALVSPERCPVDLPFVGNLHWSEKTLRFHPSEALKQGKPLISEKLQPLGKLFDLTLLQEAVVLDGFALSELFSPKAGAHLSPFDGHRLIGNFCANLVQARMNRDPELAVTLESLSQDEKVREHVFRGLVTAICLLIHDSISCGPGLAIETIGVFSPGPKSGFKINENLAALAKARLRGGSSPAQDRQPSVEFSWLK